MSLAQNNRLVFFGLFVCIFALVLQFLCKDPLSENICVRICSFLWVILRVGDPPESVKILLAH